MIEARLGGFSNHIDRLRADKDYYATDPMAVEKLLQIEKFSNYIREPACGGGHLSKKMIEMGYDVYSSDIADRGYGEVRDFLDTNFNGELTHYSTLLGRDIITNPPYILANEFMIKALSCVEELGKVALFLPMRYIESKGRKKIFEQYPPKKIRVSSSRIKCAMNGDFDSIKSSAVCYAWFVREKGYKGETSLGRFN